MRKTLLFKHYGTIISIIMVMITILGVVLLIFASQYFKQDRYKILGHNATQAAQLTYSNFRNNDYQYVNPQLLQPMYNILAGAIDADIYLTNAQGDILLSTNNSIVPGALVEKTIIDEVFSAGEYKEVGTMSGLYPYGHYTVGIPVHTDIGAPAAVIFASAPSNALNAFLTEILKMFLISALAVLILAFAAVYFITADLIRPLRKMVAAAHSFAIGDFSVRVPVESYDEMGQLALAFNNMASSLATTETARRSFTANVSHELRTPMTTIGGFIDGILDGTIPEDKADYYLKIVSEEIKRLSRLVRSMLNIARMEAGELEINPEEFDVNDLVIKTVFTFEQAIHAKNIEVRGLDIGKILITADPDLIHQVIYNLLENAVKFTNEDGFIEVAYETGNDTYTKVIIRNSGVGISRDEIVHIFDRFYKTDKSRSKDKGGAGLGLHIVRSIVNLHGGDIWASSVEGEYCEFAFTVPSPQKNKKSKEKENPKT